MSFITSLAQDFFQHHRNTHRLCKRQAKPIKSSVACIKKIERQSAHDALANPLLHLSSLLWQNIERKKESLASIAALVDYLKILALCGRADAMQKYVLTTDQQENDAAIDRMLAKYCTDAQALEEFAQQEDFGIVFTAHPTFGLDKETLERLSEMAWQKDEKKCRTLLETIARNPPQNPKTIDLEQEHIMAQQALLNTQAALQRIQRRIIAYAKKILP